MPLGIHLRHFSSIYEGNLLIQDIIIFKIVKKKNEILIIYYMCSARYWCVFLCKWVFNVGSDNYSPKHCLTSSMIKILSDILKALSKGLVKWMVAVSGWFFRAPSLLFMDSPLCMKWMLFGRHWILFFFICPMLYWLSQPSLHDSWELRLLPSNHSIMGFEFMNHSCNSGIMVHPNYLLLQLLHRECK